MIDQTETQIQVQVTVVADQAALFTVLADPARHTEIDGSGMLQGAVDPTPITAAGQSFTMQMQYPRLGNYRTINEVVDFTDGSRIGWATAREGNPPAGVRWTWELEPAGDGRTRVTHTYDWSRVQDPAVLARVSFPRVKPEELRATVARLAAAVG